MNQEFFVNHSYLYYKLCYELCYSFELSLKIIYTENWRQYTWSFESMILNDLRNQFKEINELQI